jgi:hypothetical protein
MRIMKTRQIMPWLHWNKSMTVSQHGGILNNIHSCHYCPLCDLCYRQIPNCQRSCTSGLLTHSASSSNVPRRRAVTPTSRRMVLKYDIYSEARCARRAGNTQILLLFVMSRLEYCLYSPRSWHQRM